MPPDSDALIGIATAVAASARLRFVGIQAYEGHVAGLADPAARRAALDASAILVRRAIDRLAAAGFAVDVVDLRDVLGPDERERYSLRWEIGADSEQVRELWEVWLAT